MCVDIFEYKDIFSLLKIDFFMCVGFLKCEF